MIVNPEKSKICLQCLKNNRCHSDDIIYFVNDVDKLYRLARVHKKNKYFNNCNYYVRQDFKEYLNLKNDEWPYSNEIRFVIFEYYQHKKIDVNM